MKIENIFQTVRLKEYRAYDNLIDTVDINTVDEDNKSLLHEAVVADNEYVVKDLLERGIDPDLQDSKGLTALHYAALHNRTDIAKTIVNKGGDVNIVDEHGNNALWTATFNARGSYTIVEIYAKASGDYHNKNQYGKSALDFASQINDSEIIKIFEA